jgi:hypothetical protein
VFSRQISCWHRTRHRAAAPVREIQRQRSSSVECKHVCCKSYIHIRPKQQCHSYMSLWLQRRRGTPAGGRWPVRLVSKISAASRSRRFGITIVGTWHLCPKMFAYDRYAGDGDELRWFMGAVYGEMSEHGTRDCHQNCCRLRQLQFCTGFFCTGLLPFARLSMNGSPRWVCDPDPLSCHYCAGQGGLIAIFENRRRRRMIRRGRPSGGREG